MSDCFNYNFSLLDLIIPQYYIFLKLCTSESKTKIFIVSFIRILLWLSLFVFFKKTELIHYCSDNNLKILGFHLILVMLIINIFYMLIVIIKIPLLNKDLINKEVNGINNFLMRNRISKPVEDTSINVTITPANISIPIKSNFKYN